MEISEFEAQINSKKAEIADAKENLERIRLELIEAAKRFITDYTKREVESCIFKYPERTKELGLEKLGELKKELTQAIGTAPQDTEARLKQTDHWLHLNPLPDDFAKSGETRSDLRIMTGDAFRKVIREMLGYAGQLIIRYGYDQLGIVSYWERREGKLPRWSIDFTLSTEINSLLSEYSKAAEKYIDLNADLLKLQEEKVQAEAQDLWNRA